MNADPVESVRKRRYQHRCSHRSFSKSFESNVCVLCPGIFATYTYIHMYTYANHYRTQLAIPPAHTHSYTFIRCIVRDPIRFHLACSCQVVQSHALQNPMDPRKCAAPSFLRRTYHNTRICSYMCLNRFTPRLQRCPSAHPVDPIRTPCQIGNVLRLQLG